MGVILGVVAEYKTIPSVRHTATSRSLKRLFVGLPIESRHQIVCKGLLGATIFGGSTKASFVSNSERVADRIESGLHEPIR